MKPSRDLLPRLSSTLVLLAALWSFVSIPFAHQHGVPLVDDIFTTLGVPSGPNLFLALSLLIVGTSLRRGLRFAWVIALGTLVLELLVFAAAMVVMLLDGFEDELSPLDGVLLAAGVLITVAWTVAFIVRRRDFPARMRHGALRRALLTLAAGLLLAIALVFAASWLVPGHLHGVEHLWFSFRSVTGLSLPRSISDGSPGPHWLATLGGVLGAAALFWSVWQFTQSAQRSELVSPEDELRIRRMLATNGNQDSLGYFATRRDKSVIFSPDGRAGSPTGCSAPCAWPPAIPWAPTTRGPRRLPRGSASAVSTRGAWLYSPRPRRAPRRTWPPVCAPVPWATRPCWRPTPSPWRAAPCARSSGPWRACARPAAPSPWSATASWTPPPCSRSSSCPRIGAGTRRTAASPWR